MRERFGARSRRADAAEAGQIDERHPQGPAAGPLIGRDEGNRVRRLTRQGDVDRRCVLVAVVRPVAVTPGSTRPSVESGLRLLLREVRARFQVIRVALARAHDELLDRLERQRGQRAER